MYQNVFLQLTICLFLGFSDKVCINITQICPQVNNVEIGIISIKQLDKMCITTCLFVYMPDKQAAVRFSKLI